MKQTSIKEFCQKSVFIERHAQDQRRNNQALIEDQRTDEVTNYSSFWQNTKLPISQEQ